MFSVLHERCDYCYRPCPLCRQKGPFVPVSFVFPSYNTKQLKVNGCSTLSSSNNPNCVFNPCGHVARREVLYCVFMGIFQFMWPSVVSIGPIFQ